MGNVINEGCVINSGDKTGPEVYAASSAASDDTDDDD